MQLTNEDLIRLMEWFDMLEGPDGPEEFPTERDHLIVLKLVKLSGPQDDEPGPTAGQE